jgi:hypothetical protein
MLGLLLRHNSPYGAHSAEWGERVKSMTKKSMTKSGRIILITATSLVASIILVLAITHGLRIVGVMATMISGKVVSAKTGQPAPDALVVVESLSPLPWDGPGLGKYVKTDDNGRFSAEVKGEVRIRVWKSGFAMAGMGGSGWQLAGKELLINIRELASGNAVPEQSQYKDMNVGDGFSFVLGKIVSGEDQNADFRLVKDQKSGKVLIEALGEGGFVYQEYGSGVDFYNTPEAPISGYFKQSPVDMDSMGIFYATTRDGKHYAKVRLITPAFKLADTSNNFTVHAVQWAYQPDGTRNLEIAVGKKYLFPFERFGLNRDSLK